MMKKRMLLLFLMLILLLSMTLELTAQTPDHGRWHHPLFLANNNYWKKRAVLTLKSVNSYDGASIAFEIGQTGSQLNLAGVDARSIRVCTEAGLEVAYVCFDNNSKLFKTGEMKNGYQLVIPVECTANENVKYYVYYDNSTAGEVRQCTIYQYENITFGEYMVQSVDYETLTLAKVGKKNPTSWYDDNPADGNIWNYRVPIMVANLSDTPSDKLTIVNLTRFENWKGMKINNDSLRIVDGETEIRYIQTGMYTSFFTTIPAKSYKYFHAYFSTNESIQPPVMLDYTEIARDNTVDNPAFIQTYANGTRPTHWAISNEGSLDSVGIATTGLYYTKSATYSNSSNEWVGFYQNVAVDPAELYLFTCWTKLTSDSTGIYHTLNFRNDQNKDCLYKNAVSVPSNAVPGGDWALSARAISTPDDIAGIYIDLTTNKKNTVEYDGVLLSPVNYGETDRVQVNPLVQQADEVQLWGVQTIEKVFIDSPAPQIITDVTACSARKERESMQVAIRSKTTFKGTGGLSLSLTSLTHETENAQLTDIEIQEILYVPIDTITKGYNVAAGLKDFHRQCAGATDGMITPQSLIPGNDGWIGLWPDPIKPLDGPLDLTADETRSLLITVNVPEGVPAGIYRGTLEAKQGTTTKASINIEFRVWGFEIPETNHLITLFDLDKLPDDDEYIAKTIAKYLIQEGIIPSGLPTEEIIKKLHLYYPLMWEKYKKYRIEPNKPFPDPIFDYDTQTVDDASFDVACDLYFNTYKFQTTYSPRIFFKGMHASDPYKMFGTEFSYTDTTKTTVDPTYAAKFTWAVDKYQTMMKAKNLADKSWFYLWDEPYSSTKANDDVTRDIASLCDLIHATDPTAKVYVSTRHYFESLNGKVDVYGICPNSMIDRTEIDALKATGTTLIYTMDGQYCFDTPYYGTERTIPYFCKTFDVKGFEYWGSDDLPAYNPFKWPWHWKNEEYAARDSNGDGYFFYMGRLNDRIEILPTTRLDQIREGLEDYEYITILTEFVEQGTGTPADLAEAQAILTLIDDKVNNHFYLTFDHKSSTKYIDDPGLFVRLKTRMGALIEKINATPENMLVNGDFTNDYASWTTYKEGGLYNDVSFTITPEKSAQVQITNGGNNTYSIQLYQPGVTIEQNTTYTVSFNAKASSPRSINAMVGMVNSPWAPYSNVETVNLTTDMQTYTFTFTMQNVTDTNARLEFELGTGSNVDITIDDVVLYKHN